MSGTKRYDYEVKAPGAKEVHLRQVLRADGTGGFGASKGCVGKDSCKIKTFKKIPGGTGKPADSPAYVQIKIKWKADAGGGTETLTARVGSSQTKVIKTPIERTQAAIAVEQAVRSGNAGAGDVYPLGDTLDGGSGGAGAEVVDDGWFASKSDDVATGNGLKWAIPVVVGGYVAVGGGLLYGVFRLFRRSQKQGQRARRRR